VLVHQSRVAGRLFALDDLTAEEHAASTRRLLVRRRRRRRGVMTTARQPVEFLDRRGRSVRRVPVRLVSETTRVLDNRRDSLLQPVQFVVCVCKREKNRLTTAGSSRARRASETAWRPWRGGGLLSRERGRNIVPTGHTRTTRDGTPRECTCPSAARRYLYTKTRLPRTRVWQTSNARVSREDITFGRAKTRKQHRTPRCSGNELSRSSRTRNHATLPTKITITTTTV